MFLVVLFNIEVNEERLRFPRFDTHSASQWACSGRTRTDWRVRDITCILSIPVLELDHMAAILPRQDEGLMSEGEGKGMKHGRLPGGLLLGVEHRRGSMV